VEFAKTDAFRWLTLHAQEYGFELSFPENNPQGVSYQPWHWRFVASPEAQTIFSRSKSGQ
jgi:D-alanyl-D-alanine carboxypeptidase